MPTVLNSSGSHHRRMRMSSVVPPDMSIVFAYHVFYSSHRHREASIYGIVPFHGIHRYIDLQMLLDACSRIRGKHDHVLHSFSPGCQLRYRRINNAMSSFAHLQLSLKLNPSFRSYAGTSLNTACHKYCVLRIKTWENC